MSVFNILWLCGPKFRKVQYLPELSLYNCSISKFTQIGKGINNILGKWYLFFKEIKAFYRNRFFKHIFTIALVKRMGQLHIVFILCGGYESCGGSLYSHSLSWGNITSFTAVVVWNMKVTSSPQSSFSTWDYGHTHAQSLNHEENEKWEF